MLRRPEFQGPRLTTGGPPQAVVRCIGALFSNGCTDFGWESSRENLCWEVYWWRVTGRSPLEGLHWVSVSRSPLEFHHWKVFTGRSPLEGLHALPIWFRPPYRTTKWQKSSNLESIVNDSELRNADNQLASCIMHNQALINALLRRITTPSSIRMHVAYLMNCSLLLSGLLNDLFTGDH